MNFVSIKNLETKVVKNIATVKGGEGSFNGYNSQSGNNAHGNIDGVK